MNHCSVPVRFPRSVRMQVGGMQVKSGQQQHGWEKQENNPYTPGRYRISQHNFFIVLLQVLIKKSLPSQTPCPLNSSAGECPRKLSPFHAAQ